MPDCYLPNHFLLDFPLTDSRCPGTGDAYKFVCGHPGPYYTDTPAFRVHKPTAAEAGRPHPEELIREFRYRRWSDATLGPHESQTGLGSSYQVI